MRAQISKALRHALYAAPAAALAMGVIAPVALGDPGDLDPAFADVGRYNLPVEGRGVVWSIEPQEERLLLSGGFEGYAPGDCSGCIRHYARGFWTRIWGDGVFDDSFWPTNALNNLEVFDTAIRADDKIVGVGHRLDGYLLFRLTPTGDLDDSFGTDGILELPDLQSARSLVLDPDDSIVVAGIQGNDIKVLRLLENGSADNSFGTSGVFTNPTSTSSDQSNNYPRIIRATDGGYRVTDNDGDVETGTASCRVIGVTANGALDTSFGDAGYAGISPGADGSVKCNGIVQSADGKLLVGGSASGHALVVRLLDSGAPDAGFAIDVLPATEMIEATALALDPASGGVVVAGQPAAGVTGSIVARLLKQRYARCSIRQRGHIVVRPRGHVPPLSVNAMHVQSNGDIVVGGGRTSARESAARPYAARLIGGDGDGPGVLAISSYQLQAAEGGQAEVTVRRIGGNTGAVSVAYATPGTIWTGADATAGADDYTPVSGRLDWADGDASDKQIFVPIASDAGAAEEVENFGIEISDPQGGAGLGTLAAIVEIDADGSPGGLFAVEAGGWFDENVGTLGVSVERRYYTQGAVSVTVVPHSGTATAGEDFAGDPVTLTWADGEGGTKIANFAITDDPNEESDEDCSFDLADATGGAVIGPNSTASGGISANDAPQSSSGAAAGRIIFEWRRRTHRVAVAAADRAHAIAARRAPYEVGIVVKGEIHLFTRHCEELVMASRIARIASLPVLLLLSTAAAWAGRGDIDPSYGEGGIVSATNGAVLALPGDRLVILEVTGEGLRVRMVDATGRSVPTFGEGGAVSIPTVDHSGPRPPPWPERRHDLRGAAVGRRGPWASATRQKRPASRLVREPWRRSRRACAHHETGDGICRRSRREDVRRGRRRRRYPRQLRDVPRGCSACSPMASRTPRLAKMHSSKSRISSSARAPLFSARAPMAASSSGMVRRSSPSMQQATSILHSAWMAAWMSPISIGRAFCCCPMVAC